MTFQSHESSTNRESEQEPAPVSSPWLGQWVYTSQARDNAPSEDFSDIVRVSRVRNRRDGLTGVLVSFEGRYIQYLEGPFDALEAAMRRIQADPRHRGLSVLRLASINRRLFEKSTLSAIETDAKHGRKLLDAAWSAMPTSAREESGLDVLQRLTRAARAERVPPDRWIGQDRRRGGERRADPRLRTLLYKARMFDLVRAWMQYGLVVVALLLVLVLAVLLRQV